MIYKVYKVDQNFDILKLDSSVKEHCDKYTDLTMKKISAFAYFKMLELVQETYGINLFDRKIDFDGKPKFVDYKMFFSISHEDDLVAVIIDDERECGIDLTRRNVNTKIADKILSKAEKLQYEAVKEEDKEEYIARKWAMKEAYGKKTGLGLCDQVYRTTVEMPIKRVTFRDKVYYLCFTE